jgi:apolipoprotein N-acyltransferase
MGQRQSTSALPLGVSGRDALLVVGIALLGALAFPPVGLWPMSLVSASLFLFLLHRKDVETARNCGLLFGLLYSLGTMYWFFAIFGVLTIALMGIMAGYFGLLATLIALTRTKPLLLRAALVALFGVGIEWLRGDAWYLRFPWYTSAHALAADPAWIAPVRWLGTYGFSYVMWLIAALGAFGRPLVWSVFLLLPLVSFLLPAVEKPDRQVLLVQTEDIWALEKLFPSILEEKEKIDLAVFPEYAYTQSAREILKAKQGPAALARKASSPVVFGAVEGDYFGPRFSNVAVVIDASGELLGMFPKQRPVPLMRDGVPGTERPVFPLGQGVLGVAICYDLDAPAIASSLVSKGATVFVLPTFDAMSWTRIQHVHHELIIRLRAVENDRWILRAASSGRSEVINPRGIPSFYGIGIGETDFIVLPFSHRNTTALGGQLSFLGPAAGVGTLLAILCYAWGAFRARRRASPKSL